MSRMSGEASALACAAVEPGRSDAPSSLQVFRIAAMLVGVAVGLQPLVRLASFGPLALPHLREPAIVPLLGALMTDAGAAALRLAFSGYIALCVIGLVAFAAAAARITASTAPLSRPAMIALLAMQALLGLLLAPEWLYVVSAEVALLLAPRTAWRWWLLQATSLALAQWLGSRADILPLVCTLSGAPPPLASAPREVVLTMIDIATALMFQALAFGVGTLARLEQRRRADLSLAHRELLATRELIGETAAAQERLRVARELHDCVGHQLTAMKLHLDLATHQTASCEPLRRASELAQALLAEVRAVVSAERATAAVRPDGVA